MAGVQAEALPSDPSPNGATAELEKETEEQTRKQRKRPKLEEQHLLGKYGLPYLMAKAVGFKKNIKSHKAKGYEAHDLRKFLEVYMGWREQLFVHVNFDDFIYKVEKLTNTRRMRGMIDSLKREEIERVRDKAANGGKDRTHTDNVDLDEDAEGTGWVGMLDRGNDKAAAVEETAEPGRIWPAHVNKEWSAGLQTMMP
eukprot:scaffold823_cov397-Prasinococcus_capsulatus_cf.AAC.13